MQCPNAHTDNPVAYANKCAADTNPGYTHFYTSTTDSNACAADTDTGTTHPDTSAACCTTG